jgi:hypothetical protein
MQNIQNNQNKCYRLGKYDTFISKIQNSNNLKYQTYFTTYHLTVLVHNIVLTSSPLYLRGKLKLRSDFQFSKTIFAEILHSFVPQIPHVQCCNDLYPFLERIKNRSYEQVSRVC